MNKLLFVLIFIFAFTLVTFAQTNQSEEVIELSSNGCEIDELNFNIVFNAANKIGKKDFLIAIARLGTGDKKRNLNQLRLKATREWLVGKADFPINRLVLAEGEKVESRGRVEFYISGKLTHIIFPKPNFGLCVECCSGQ